MSQDYPQLNRTIGDIGMNLNWNGASHWANKARIMFLRSVRSYMISKNFNQSFIDEIDKEIEEINGNN